MNFVVRFVLAVSRVKNGVNGGKCGRKSVKKCDRMVGEDDRIEIYPLTEILPP